MISINAYHNIRALPGGVSAWTIKRPSEIVTPMFSARQKTISTINYLLIEQLPSVCSSRTIHVFLGLKGGIGHFHLWNTSMRIRTDMAMRPTTAATLPPRTQTPWNLSSNLDMEAFYDSQQRKTPHLCGPILEYFSNWKYLKLMSRVLDKKPDRK